MQKHVRQSTHGLAREALCQLAHNGVFDLLAFLVRNGLDSPIGCTVGPDSRDSAHNVTYLSEGGLSLGEKTHYLDPEHATTRKHYVALINDIAYTMFGDISAPGDVVTTPGESVLRVETELASHMFAPEERRNPIHLYNPFGPRSRFLPRASDRHSARTKRASWRRFWDGLAGPQPTKVVVDHPAYADAAVQILCRAQRRGRLGWYVWWKTVEWAGRFMPKINTKLFAFFDKRLNGQRRITPEWRRAVYLVGGVYDSTMSRLYMAAHLPDPDALRTRLVRMCELLRSCFERRLERLAWMTPRTRRLAVAKLRAMQFELVAPRAWAPEPDTPVSADADIIRNLRRLGEWQHRYERSRDGTPVDLDLWIDATPETVNAFYYPEQNRVVVPAGTLAPPYYDLDASLAHNLGGIGATIGHEMTHGFDDEGRLYDARGNLRDWWTPDDAHQFSVRRAAVVKQYSQLHETGKAVNGELTCGENIADIGGLAIAQDALMDDCRRRDLRQPDVDRELTAFYTQYAKAWAEKCTPEYMRERLDSDPHSPERHRVNVVVGRMPEFKRLFGVRPGDPMHDPSPIDIW